MTNRLLYITITLGILIPGGSSASTFLVEYFAATNIVQNHHLFGTVDPGQKVFDITIDATQGSIGNPTDTPNFLHVRAFPTSPTSGKITSMNFYDWGVSGQHPQASVSTSTYNLELIDFNRLNGLNDIDLNILLITNLFVEPNASAPTGATGTLSYFGVLKFLSISPMLSSDVVSLDNELMRGDLFMREIVSAVPIPAAVWLFGTALIGLVGFGKRRKTI